MSIFVDTQPGDILNHPLNDSKSKFMYSFSRQERFQSPQIVCQKQFYDPVDLEHKRSANMGLGIKSDFTKTTFSNYAPDSNYNLESVFENQKKKQKGKIFGESRDNMKQQGYIPQQKQANPGPNKYEYKSLAKCIKYSLRPRTTRQDNPSFLGGKQSFAENPGPGAYNPECSINESGNYKSAKYKSSGTKTFNPTSSKRFQQDKFKQSIMPGPGKYLHTYEQQNCSRKGTFGNSSRTSFVDQISSQSTVPGVGSYKQRSDFGQYASRQEINRRKKQGVSQSMSTLQQYQSFQH